MSESEPQEEVSRRKALKIIVGSATTAVSLPVIGEGAARVAAPTCHITSPAAQMPTHTPKFFRPEQIRSLEALSETIIPADDHSPGAKAARVWEYIDEIVAEAGKETKDLWTRGLALLNEMAQTEHGKDFGDCTADQQVNLVERIARNEDHPTQPPDHFFVAAKRATIDGYYTSAIGIHQDLQYQGNTALEEFPGCTHPEHKA